MSTFSEAFGVNKFLSLPIDLSTAGMLSIIFQVLNPQTYIFLKRLVPIKQREQEEQYHLIAEKKLVAMILKLKRKMRSLKPRF
jgi:hypothetical protein